MNNMNKDVKEGDYNTKLIHDDQNQHGGMVISRERKQ